MAYQAELPGLYLDKVISDASTQSPVLINRNPEPNEEGIRVDTTISFEIVDVGNDGINRTATRVFIDNVLAFEGGAAQEFKSGFNGFESQVIETADTLSLVIQPTSSFNSLQTVEVRVVSETQSLALPLEVVYSFTIEDLTAPIVVAAQAISAKSIRISFNEPIRIVGDGDYKDALNHNNYLFSLVTTPTVSLTPIKVTANGLSSVDVEVDIEMSQRATYLVTVKNIEDVFGNPIGDLNNQAAFTGFVPPNRPKNRDFELYQLLPEINRQQDQTKDLQKFIYVLQDVLDLLLTDIDRFIDIIDLDFAPEPYLDCMLNDLGNPFDFELNELQKRRLLSVLVQIYKQKGTAAGIKNAIRLFLGIEVTAIEAYHGNTLVLGESELGVDWELGPSNQFALYAFDIAVERVLTEIERKQIREIVKYLKPAGTHFVEILEPGELEFIDHWELGLRLLGTETILH